MSDDPRLDQQRRDRVERSLAKVHAIRSFNASETGNPAFMGQPLVQLTLPHSDPGDLEFYESRCAVCSPPRSR